MSAARHRGLLLALMLVAAIWLGTLAASRAPPSKPLDAPPSEFSGERAKVLLRQLLGDDLPHPLGSAANAQLRERIVTALRELGLTPSLQSGFTVCHDGVCGEPTDILARIQGTEAGERAVLLVAHYDSVAAGPGASDDGSGVAALLEIGRILQLLPRTRQSIILLFDDGEEPGLLGAQAFVRHHPWAAAVSAAVNLDARGTSGPSLMFETGSANRWLMNLYAAAVARPLTNSVYYAVYQRLPNDTDFTIFKAAGYQGFNFAFIGDVAHYHTPLDDWLHADARSLQAQGDNALATLLALANADAATPPAGEAVYFDLFGRLLVRIPQAWILPAALIALLLVIASGMRLMQLRRLSAAALLSGLCSLGAALVIGAAAAAALMALLRVLGAIGAAGAAGAVAHPWALELSFAALAFCVAALLGSRLQRRAGFWGLWYAAALLYALLAVALAHWLAGGSYLALLPALAAPLLPAIWSGRGTGELAGLVMCGVTFMLVLPIAAPLYGALGADGLPLLTLLLIYSSFSLAALCTLGARRLHRIAIATAALATLIGVVAAMLLPRYTAESPQRLNLYYYFDADRQQARWIAEPLSGLPPAPLLHAAAFAPSRQLMLLWSDPVWEAAAPALPMSAPLLKLTGTARTAEQVRYRVRINSPRAAPIMTLLFPPAANVKSVQLEGNATALPATPARLSNGWLQLRLFGVPPQGQELSFDASESAFELRLLDQSFGLPAPGVVLQRSRAHAAVPSREGDVTIAMRSYRLPP
jgi:hypothetical protein